MLHEARRLAQNVYKFNDLVKGITRETRFDVKFPVNIVINKITTVFSIDLRASENYSTWREMRNFLRACISQ